MTGRAFLRVVLGILAGGIAATSAHAEIGKDWGQTTAVKFDARIRFMGGYGGSLCTNGAWYSADAWNIMTGWGGENGGNGFGWTTGKGEERLKCLTLGRGK